MDVLQATYCTAALICVELATDDTLVDLLRWALAVQDLALTNSGLRHRTSLHVNLIKHFFVISILIHLFL